MKQRYHSLQRIAYQNAGLLSDSQQSQDSSDQQRPPLAKKQGSLSSVLPDIKTGRSSFCESSRIQCDRVKLFQRITYSIDSLQDSVVDYLSFQDSAKKEHSKDLFGFKNLLHATVGNFLVDFSKFEEKQANQENLKSNGSSSFEENNYCLGPTTAGTTGGRSRMALSSHGGSCGVFSEYNHDEYQMNQEIERLREIIEQMQCEKDNREQLIEDMQYEDLANLREEKCRFYEMRQELSEYVKQCRLDMLRSDSKNQISLLNELYDVLVATTERAWKQESLKGRYADDTDIVRLKWEGERFKKNGRLRVFYLKRRSKSMDSVEQMKKKVQQGKKYDNNNNYLVQSEMQDVFEKQHRQINQLTVQNEIEFSVMHTFLRQYTQNTHILAAELEGSKLQLQSLQLQESICDKQIMHLLQEGQNSIQSGNNLNAGYQTCQNMQQQKQQQSLAGNLYTLNNHNGSEYNNSLHEDDDIDSLSCHSQIRDLPLQFAAGTQKMNFCNETSQLMEPSFNQDINLSCINKIEDGPQQVINFLDTLEQKPTSRFMCQSSFKKSPNQIRSQDMQRLSMEFRLAEKEKAKGNGKNLECLQMSFNDEENQGNHGKRKRNYDQSESHDGQEQLKGQGDSQERSRLESFMNENFDEVNNSLVLDDFNDMEIQEREQMLQQQQQLSQVGGRQQSKKRIDGILPKLDLSSINCSEQMILFSCKNAQLSSKSGMMSCKNTLKNGFSTTGNNMDMLRGLNEDIGVAGKIEKGIITISEQEYQNYLRILNEKNSLLEREAEMQEIILELQQQIVQIAADNDFLQKELKQERENIEQEHRTIMSKKEKLMSAKEQLSERKKQEEEKEKLVGQQQLMNMLQEKKIIAQKQTLDAQWSELESRKCELERLERVVTDEWETAKSQTKKLAEFVSRNKTINDQAQQDILKQKQELIVLRKHYKQGEKELKEKQEEFERDHRTWEVVKEELVVEQEEFKIEKGKLQKEKGILVKEKESIQIEKNNIRKERLLTEKDREELQREKNQLDRERNLWGRERSQIEQSQQQTEGKIRQAQEELNRDRYNFLQEKSKFIAQQEKIKADSSKMKGLVPTLKNLASKMNDTNLDSQDSSVRTHQRVASSSSSCSSKRF